MGAPYDCHITIEVTIFIILANFSLTLIFSWFNVSPLIDCWLHVQMFSMPRNIVNNFSLHFRLELLLKKSAKKTLFRFPIGIQSAPNVTSFFSSHHFSWCKASLDIISSTLADINTSSSSNMPPSRSDHSMTLLTPSDVCSNSAVLI